MTRVCASVLAGAVLLDGDSLCPVLYQLGVSLLLLHPMCHGVRAGADSVVEPARILLPRHVWNGLLYVMTRSRHNGQQRVLGTLMSALACWSVMGLATPAQAVNVSIGASSTRSFSIASPAVAPALSEAQVTSSIDGTSVNVAFSALEEPSVDSYTVYANGTPTILTSSSSDAGKTLSLTVLNRTPGSSVSVYVVAKAKAVVLATSPTTTIITLLPAPPAPTVVSADAQSILLSWVRPAWVSSYDILDCTSDPCSDITSSASVALSTSTAYARLTHTSSSQAYAVALRSHTASAVSSVGSILTTVAPADDPLSLAVSSPSPTTLNISYAPIPSTATPPDALNVGFCPSRACIPTKTTRFTSSPFVLGTLLAGTEYSVVISPVRGVGAQAVVLPSVTVIARTQLATPSAVKTVRVSDSSMSLSWAAVANATSYLLQACLVSDPSQCRTRSVPPSAPSVVGTVGGLSADTDYLVTVKALNSESVSLASAASPSLLLQTALSPPTLTAQEASLGSVGFSFSPQEAANAYVVSRCEQTTAAACTLVPSSIVLASDLSLSESSVASFSAAVAPGSQWHYSLTALHVTLPLASGAKLAAVIAGADKASPASSVLTLTSIPSAPSAAPACKQAGPSLVCTSTPVPGAVSYALGDGSGQWYATDLTPTLVSKTAVTLAIPLAGLPLGRVSSVVVKAHNEAGDSTSSSAASVLLLDAPADVEQVAASSTTVTLSWSKVASALSYQVLRAGKVIATVPASDVPSVTIVASRLPGLVSVVASPVAKPSAASSVSVASNVTVQTAPAPPSNVSCSRMDDVLTCSWTASPGASRYQVLLEGVKVGLPVVTTTASVTSSASVSHVTVQAIDALGSSDASKVFVINRLAAPSVAVLSTPTSITLSWPKVLGASSYIISGLPGKESVTSPAVSYTVSSLSVLTAYRFAVTAVGKSYERSATTWVDAATSLTAPPGLACSGVGGSVTCLIPHVNGAQGFQIFSGSTLLLTVPAASSGYTTATIQNLPFSVSQLITARVVCQVTGPAGGAATVLAVSSPSAVNTIKLLSTPKLTVVTAAATKKTPAMVSASWSSVVGAKSYTVSFDGGAPVVQSATKKSWSISGDLHTVSVTAVAVNGDTSSPATVSTRSAPASPSNVSALADGASRALVSWTAPTVTGGAPVSSYTVSELPEHKSCTVQAPASSCAVSGLDVALMHTFSVQASHAWGTSVASSVTSALRLVGAPTAPTNVVIAPSSQTLALSWAPPSYDGSASVTSYSVVLTPSDGSCTLSGMSALCSGLSNGVQYSVSVSGVNSYGNGSAATVTATPRTVPDAPSITSASALVGSASAVFSSPESNATAEVQSYTLTATPVSGGAALSVTGVASPLVISGLSNGVTYSLTVTAANIAGASTSSNSVSVTPRTVPSAPTSVVVSDALDSHATISFTAPSSTGGAPISGYVVTSAPDSLSCTSVSSSCTIWGLTNGTAYAFTVKALNSAGSSLSSAPSAYVIPKPYAIVAQKAGSFISGSASSYADAYQGVGLSGAPNELLHLGESHWWNVEGSEWDASQAFLDFDVSSLPASRAVGSVALSLAKAPYSYSVGDGSVQVRAFDFGSTLDASDWRSPAALATMPVLGQMSLASFVSTSTNTIVLSGDELKKAVDAHGHVRLVLTSACMAASCASNGAFETFWGVGSNVSDVLRPTLSVTTSSPSPPSPPSSVSALSADSSVAVSWVSSAANGSAITSYKATASPGGRSCSSSSTSCVISGLTNGTSYTVTVTAVNAIGSSSPSDASSAVIPATVPSVPSAVLAVAGNASATVSWSASLANGAPVSSYTVTSSPGGFSCTTASTACIVTGLSNGASYSFSVTAANVAGLSDVSSASNVIIPATVPSAPSSVSGVRSNSAVTVSWVAPSSNGSAISSYTVTSSPGAFTCSSSSTSCTVSGLSNGTAYTFTVTASNAIGTSVSSSASSPLTPAGPPSAPSAPVAVAQDGSAAVSWSAPASNGAAITLYSVTSSPGALTCSSPSLSCNVSGLTNDVSYTFSVTASNAAGRSVSSASSAPVTPFLANGASGTGSNGVHFTNGIPDSATSGMIVAPATYSGSVGCGSWYNSTLSPAVVSGVDNGSCKDGDVTWTVVWQAGMVTTVSAYTAPASPLLPSATASNGQVLVSWLVPNATGSSPITSYTVTSTPGGYTCTTASLSCTVTGLSNGTAYSFKVSASNAVGTSAASSASAAAVPFVGDGASGTGSNGVHFTNGIPDSATSGMIVAPATYSGSVGCGSWYNSTLSPAVVSGVDNGSCKDGDVTWTVVWQAGMVTTVSAYTAPASPLLPSATASNGQVLVSWLVPNATGSSPITSYTVTSTPGGYTCTTASLSCTVTGLSNGTAYSFKVSASNAVGTSAASSASLSVTPATVPSAPSSVTASPANVQVTVSWVASAANGSAVTSYRVTSSPGGFTCSTSSTSCVVSGLTNGTAYTFTVTATNSVGTSAASAASAAVSPNSVPAPSKVAYSVSLPTAPLTSVPYGTAVVSMTNTPNTSGDAFDRYVVDYRRSSDSAWTSVYSLASPLLRSANYNYDAGCECDVATGTEAGGVLTLPDWTAGSSWQVRVAQASASSVGIYYSFTVSPAASTPVSGPAGLTAASGPGGTSEILSWTAATNQVGVNIKYTSGATTTVLPTIFSSATTALIPGLSPSSSYSFSVQSIVPTGLSGWSAVSATTGSTVTVSPNAVTESFSGSSLNTATWYQSNDCSMALAVTFAKSISASQFNSCAYTPNNYYSIANGSLIGATGFNGGTFISTASYSSDYSTTVVLSNPSSASRAWFALVSGLNSSSLVPTSIVALDASCSGCVAVGNSSGNLAGRSSSTYSYYSSVTLRVDLIGDFTVVYVNGVLSTTAYTPRVSGGSKTGMVVGSGTYVDSITTSVIA